MRNLLAWRGHRDYASAIALPSLFSPEGTLRGRRLLVFGAVFIASAASGLIYTYTRPAEYRAAARVQIVPASALPAADQNVAISRNAADPNFVSFLTSTQVLTSRPLLTEVIGRLQNSGDLPAGLGPDPVDRVQRMLDTEIVKGTQIVRLQADGRPPQFLPELVNTLIGVFQEHINASYRAATGADEDQLRDEVAVLKRKMAEKRLELDAYRTRYDIVSAERDENQLLSAAKGLGAALTEANSKLAAAEGQLRAIRSVAESGRSLIGAKDDPTVAGLEQRASQLREQLSDFQEKYTAQYLDADPNVKMMRTRLDNLEQQIKTARAAGQRLALATAEEQANGARAAVAQLQQQVENNKSAVQAFTTRFEDYKSMQADLANLEQLHRTALDRLTKLEARVREAAPRVAVLEAASVPQFPWRPDYTLDAGISLVGAMLLGFLAVWFTEFFYRTAPTSDRSVEPQPWWPISLALEGAAATRPLLAAEPARLAGPDPAQRELTDAEIAALLRAAQDDGRLILALLLTGVSGEEISAVRWEDLDADAGMLRVPGESARDLVLIDPLRRLIAARRIAGTPPSGPLLCGAGGASLTADDIVRQVLYAAFDAGLAGADEVTPHLLRHTYLVHLVRQGIRFADLGRLVGRVPQHELAVYMRAAPSQSRIPFEQVDPVLPGLRGLGEASA